MRFSLQLSIGGTQCAINIGQRAVYKQARVCSQRVWANARKQYTSIHTGNVIRLSEVRVRLGSTFSNF